MCYKSDDSWKIVLLYLTDFIPPCVGVKATWTDRITKRNDVGGLSEDSASTKTL